MTSPLAEADRRLRRWTPAWGARIVIAVAFLGSSVLQIVGVPFTSSFGTRTRIDLDVYRIGGQIWQDGAGLYADGSMPFTSDGIWLPFTYPPFAALGFAPLSALQLEVAGLLVSILTIALTAVIVHLVLGVLGVGSRRNRWPIAALITAVVIWFNPLWMTLGFGQINIVLMTMILLDIFVVGRMDRAREDSSDDDDAGARTSRRGSPWTGALIGLATAIKLTPAVYVAVFVVTRRWRAMITSVAAFLGAGLLAWVWLPEDSFTYWTHTLFHTTRIGDPAGRINQNLNAMWLRLVDTDTASLLWMGSVVAATALAAAAVFALRPIEAFTTPGPRVGAMLVVCAVAVWGLLISPTTWAHHWVWGIPVILATATVSMRVDSLWRSLWYLALALSGTAVLAVGPFQLLSPTTGSWSALDHIVANSYSLWGVAVLFTIWLAPYRDRRAEPVLTIDERSSAASRS